VSQSVQVDRAALVRRALVELVAEHGFHGASMAAVAERAGVATGTAYVHYSSKDELVLAAYIEVKRALGTAGHAAIDRSAAPRDLFRRIWHAMHGFLAADPVQARFLVQVQVSPYATAAHDAAREADDLLRSPELEELVSQLVGLPATVLYDLSLGPAVRVAASEDLQLTEADLEELASACWRAVSRS